MRARAPRRECPPSTTIDSYFEPLHARTAKLPQPTDMTSKRRRRRSLERRCQHELRHAGRGVVVGGVVVAAAAKEEEEEEALLDTAALYIYEQLEHATASGATPRHRPTSSDE